MGRKDFVEQLTIVLHQVSWLINVACMPVIVVLMLLPRRFKGTKIMCMYTT